MIQKGKEEYKLLINEIKKESTVYQELILLGEKSKNAQSKQNKRKEDEQGKESKKENQIIRYKEPK